MKYSNTVEYNISTKLDSSGLTKLQTQIKQVELTMQQMANRELLPAGRVEQAKTQLEGLSSALTKSFDSSLGMLDLAKFRSELQQSKVTADGLKSAFSMTGSQGAEAFGNLAKQIGNFNNGIERSSSSLDKMFTTFSNTFRWGLVSSFFSQFMNAIHSSVDYVKELDDSLTQIMLVTDYNRDSMNQFAKSANEAAKAVSMTTTGMTNASLIFAQQGYDLGQSQELATLSAKLANASQQDTATTSDQITAYMNAYGLENSIEELTQQMDNWALIANISAADVGELAQASQRAASMANAVGVSGEQLAAQIATIESVTREAPEQIGNGLKTLYARFSDIAAGKEDEDGFGLGKVTSELNKIGVQVLDEMGQIRDVGDIMEDLMVIWDDLDQTSKVAASQALAGKYQVNRFMALMDNTDMYQEYKGATGSVATGTLDQMNQEYAESLAGRSQKLQATLEGIFNNLFNTDSFYPFINIAQKALDLIDNLTEAMGGGLPVLTALVSGFTQLFSTNIARGINDMMSNQQIAQTRQSNLANVKGALADTGLDETGVGQYIQAGADRAGIMNGEQYTIYTDQLDNYITAATNAAKANEHLQDTYMLVAAAAGQVYEKGEDLLFKDEEGINTSSLIEELNKYKDSKSLMSDLSKVDFSAATESATSFAKALSQLNGDLDRIKTGDRSGGDSWDIEQAEDDLYRINDALTDLGKAGALTKEDFGEMQKTVQKAFDQLAVDGKISDDLAKDLDSMNISVARFSEALQRIGPETLAKGPEAIAAAIAQEVAALEAEAAAAQGAEGVISNLDRQNVINSVVTLTSSLGQLASAWMSIKNLGSIWSNEDLSNGEKFLQTILNLSMVIGQITSAFDQLGKAQKTISTLYDKLNSATQINAQALKKNADAAKQAAESSSKDNAEKVKGVAAKTADGKAAESAAEANKKLQISENGAALGATEDAAAQTADAIAKTGATAATTGLTAAVGALKTALDLLTGPVGILITIFGTIGMAAWGVYQDRIEQMKQDAQEGLDKAISAKEQLESIRTSVDEFSGKYNEFKETNEGEKELIQQAKDIALAMKEAGAEEEANAIHLATLRAEAEGTAESFDELAQEMKKAQWESEAQANLEVIRSAKEVLQTQNKGMEQVLNDQERLKNAQQELNNLDPWKPNYEARKTELEALISTLKETIAGEQEAINAANAAMNAQGQLAGMNALGLNGDNNGMQTKARGWENIEGPADAIRTADAETLRDFFSQNVQGFELLDSIEQLDFMLQNVQDDAQKAAIQVQQLLESNSSLGEHHFGDNTYTDSEEITRALEQTDLTAENSLQLIASLDTDASKAEIKAKIADVQAEMESNGGDFTLALKATLDPEELERAKEQVRDSISSMEPTDSDLDKDSFQETAKYFQEMAEELEDVPDEISLSSEALQDFTEAVLRYDDALQDADEHLDDWKKTLKNSSRSMEDAAEAFEGIRDLIGDLLDLDTSDLSHNFMESADALDLLDTAIYGTGDEADAAYDQLNALANLDMAGMLDWEDGIWSLNDSFNQLRDAATGVSDDAVYAMDTLRGVMEGTISAPEIDASAFVAGLNDMVQNGEMSVDQALAAMDGAQVEADVVTETEDQSDTKNAIGWKPVETAGVDINASIPVMPVGGPLASGAQPTMQKFSGHVGGWTFEPDTQQETETKETTVSSVGYKANKNGNGSGKISFKNGRHKSGSGGAKRNNATSGGGHSRPSSTGGGSCFVAGTFISTWGGFKPIEQIKKGNIVLSYNEQTGLNEYSEVLQTMIHDTTELIYTLYIKDEQLRVTGIHRFLIANKITCGVPQWVHAADLKVGDWVMFADGSWHVIHKIEKHLEHQIVYNFEVSGNHNYYVGRNQILAHNKGGKSCFVAGTQVSTSLGFKAIETIQPNDIVLSYNEQTGYNEYSSVVQTMIHDTKEPIYTLYIQNEQLRVTGIHRFFITKNILTGIPQWIEAEKLKVGDWVLFANGTWHVIWKIEVNIEQQTVYNFEVSGNHNYYVGRHQILAHNKGGGKKGGGGGKQKEIKSKEKREHEKDYYEEVNSQLDKTEKILSKIEKEEDRLIGDKARANQNKQLKLLQKEINLNEKKLKIQKQELKDVDALIKKEDKRAEKAALNAGVRANIPGIVFDEDGVVSNYEQISKAIDKTYNDLVKKYNEAAKKGNEELTKKIEKDMSKFDDYSKNLLEQIKRHNKLQGEIVETESDLDSLADAMEDIRIDAYKASQEAIDNLKEIKESAAELDKFFRNFDDSSFMNKFSIDDTPYGDLIEDLSKLDNIYSVTKKDANAFYQDLINQKEEALKNTKDEDEKQAIQKSIDFFTEQQDKLKDGANLENGLLGLAQQDLARLQGWMDNPKAADNIYGDNEAALFEAYQEAYNRTLGLFKDYRELVQSTRDDILDIYSDAEEAIERQIDQFDRLSEKMERISDTYTLYYGEDSYDQLDKFYAQQGSIMQAQLNQLTAAYDFWRKNYEKALENGNEELIKKAKDLMDDAEDAMLDGAKELAELWVEKFENAVEANTQSIYNKLFNGQDFNDLSSNWELQKDYMERYKDNVEKSYEIEKLRSKYTDLLNDSQNASLLTQNKIRQQMQEQLQQLQEQARVSEYDVKLANARLEILQKQIALEDAQRNKRQMQLRRDSQGNYRYVYKADQKDVKEAQDDLLDSEFDAYELTKNETISNNDRALNLVQDFLSKRADIFNKYKDDDVARKKALEELSNNYSELLAGMEEDFRDTTNGMFDVLTFMVQNGTEATAVSAANMLDNLFEKEGKFKEDTKVLWAALVNTMTGALEEFQDAIAEANDELIDQTKDLKDKMTGNDGVLTKIGSSSEKMANSLDTATQATMDLAQATDQLFTAFKADDKRMEDALAKLKKYEDQLRSTQDTTSSLSKQLYDANAAISAKTAEAQSYQNSIDLMNGSKKFEVGQVVTLKKGTWVSYHRDGDQYDSKGDNGFILSKDTQVKISHVNEHHTKGYGDTSQLAKYNIGFYEVGKEATKETGTGLANKSDTKKTERWHLNEAMLRQALTYDTGGYTGEWSNDESNLSKNGKLAVLHQKELVLNATDTENILNAVNVMREITNALKNSNMYVSTFRNAVSAGNDTIEQRVEISATFPNVSSITDIEQALLSLSDQAYQYAHRNIKG